MVFKTLKKAVSKIVGDKQEDPANSIAASKMLSLAQKSGYLQKSGGSVKSWKTRLFILVDKNLMYYKDEKVINKKIIIFRLRNHLAILPWMRKKILNEQIRKRDVKIHSKSLVQTVSFIWLQKVIILVRKNNN